MSPNWLCSELNLKRWNSKTPPFVFVSFVNMVLNSFKYVERKTSGKVFAGRELAVNFSLALEL